VRGLEKTPHKVGSELTVNLRTVTPLFYWLSYVRLGIFSLLFQSRRRGLCEKNADDNREINRPP